MSSHDFKLEVEGRFIHKYGLKGYSMLVYCYLRQKTINEGGWFGSYSEMCDMFSTRYETVRLAVRNLVWNGLCSEEVFQDADGCLVKIYKITKL